MSKSAPDTIVLKGDPLIKQHEASAAILPGLLIERHSTGAVRLQSTAGGNMGCKLVAIENDIGGDDIDHPYESGEVTRFAALRPGDEAYLVLAIGNNVAIGDLLEADGLGQVRPLEELTTSSAGLLDTLESSAQVYTNKIVGTVLAAVDSRGVAAAISRRIKVEIS